MTSRWRNPALVLVVLAPLIGEVLNGATRLSYIFAFVPQLMVWGCGALLIREAVHRIGGGWTSILLMGVALACWGGGCFPCSGTAFRVSGVPGREPSSRRRFPFRPKRPARSLPR